MATARKDRAARRRELLDMAARISNEQRQYAVGAERARWDRVHAAAQAAVSALDPEAHRPAAEAFNAEIPAKAREAWEVMQAIANELLGRKEEAAAPEPAAPAAPPESAVNLEAKAE